MTARDIARAIDRIAPEKLSARLVAEFGEYDNTGLLLEPDAGREIRRALVVLDADEETADEAIAGGFGLIVSHHPVVYRGLRSVTDRPGERTVCKLLRAGIAVYSAHLSLDAAKDGINATLARELGLLDPRPLLDLGDGAGLVFAGGFSGDVSELCRRIYRVTGAPMRVAANGREQLRKVAVCNGGGGDFLDRAIDVGCDAFVTGDVRHHMFVKAKAARLALIDAGHAETEAFYLTRFAAALQKICAGVQFWPSGGTAPYKFFGGQL